MHPLYITLIVLAIVTVVMLIVFAVYYYESVVYEENLETQLRFWKKYFSWNTGYHTRLKGYALPTVVAIEDQSIHKSIIIVAAAQNVAGCLEENIQRLVTIGKQFKEYHLCLYENNSTDITPDILLEWQEKDPNIHVLVDTTWTTEDLSRPRLAKMQIVRHKNQQFMLNIVQTLGLAPDVVLLYDIDMIGGLHPMAIPQIFQHTEYEAWDALFSNGLSYKHSWSVQGIYLWLTGVPLRDYDSLAYEGAKGETITHFNHLHKRRRIDLRTDIPVKSGFGGAALYKYQKYAEGDYMLFKKDICEHRIFHKSLQSKKLFFSKWMVTIR